MRTSVAAAATIKTSLMRCFSRRHVMRTGGDVFNAGWLHATLVEKIGREVHSTATHHHVIKFWWGRSGNCSFNLYPRSWKKQQRGMKNYCQPLQRRPNSSLLSSLVTTQQQSLSPSLSCRGGSVVDSASKPRTILENGYFSSRVVACRSIADLCISNQKIRSLSSSSSTKTPSTELLPNVALATVLFGFVIGVFLYSMNAVGRGDESGGVGGGEEDPLAQLKAEAQEARENLHRDKKGGSGGGRMTEDEILALESGLFSSSGGDDDIDEERTILEVAVAAPADIAALEEEANLKAFRQKKKHEQQHQNDDDNDKKKPWWRFGF